MRARDGPERVSEPTSEHQNLVLIDWDDTLFPTTFVRSLKPALASALVRSSSSSKPLCNHALAVETLLRVARATSHVAIVTLAQRPWVSESASAFLPTLRLEALLQELKIPVYHAQEQRVLGREPHDDEDFKRLKHSAMAQAMLQAVEECDCECLDVFSVGDSEVEREAAWDLLEELEEAGSRPQCKTLKLMEEPRLQDLTEELRKLTPLLEAMMLHGGDFDLDVHNVSDFGESSFGPFAPTPYPVHLDAADAQRPRQFGPRSRAQRLARGCVAALCGASSRTS